MDKAATAKGVVNTMIDQEGSISQSNKQKVEQISNNEWLIVTKLIPSKDHLDATGACFGGLDAN